MIDPNNITKYDRSDKELLEFWLFCILVAGKKSSWAANKVEELNKVFSIDVMFQLDKPLIKNMLMLCNVGQYERISNAIHESKSIDLRKVGFTELMQIKGIGRKSASFFLLHSREGWEGVVLDTHLLAFLRDNGVSAPMSTPQDAKKYKYLETELYRLFKEKFPNKTLAEADLTVWKAYSGKKKLALEQNAELI
jgi:thermostable 8-oxoguanine DNA glycosylase